MNGEAWLRFLRHYGPGPRNDYMYETTQRHAESETCQLANRTKKRLFELLGGMDAETDGPQPCHICQSRTAENS
jgi:hypothetical protein